MPFNRLGRRKFLGVLGGAAAVLPLAANAQQASKLPTIGFFSPLSASAANPWSAAFAQRLRELGWMGPNFPDLFRRAAEFVDKILRGAKPADIPVEQPTRFDLVVNLNTATALELTIPKTVLVRTAEIIE
jgi:hypothetical protein